MDDQPELGRPNYSANAGANASRATSTPTPVGSPRPQNEDPRIPIRAVLAAFCALLPWAWTLYLVRTPMLVPFLSSLVAIRLSRRAQAQSASRVETVIALAALLAAAVFVFIQLSVTFSRFFVYHDSVSSVIDFYLNTP